MRTQHTPGPWHVTGDYVRNENDGLVGEALNLWANVKTPTDERKANARLIAAAPDLLAACRCALADMEGSYSREDWDDDENPVALTIRELIAAIAKAGGGK